MTDSQSTSADVERTTSRLSPHVTQVLRFLVVGGSAVSTDFLTYFVLLDGVGLRPSVAKSFSFIAGAIVSFVFNRGFVFRAADQHSGRQVIAFSTLYLTTLGLNTGLNALGLALGAHKVLAWLVATGASTIANFAGMKWLVFKSQHPVRPEEKPR